MSLANLPPGQGGRQSADAAISGNVRESEIETLRSGSGMDTRGSDRESDATSVLLYGLPAENEETATHELEHDLHSRAGNRGRNCLDFGKDGGIRARVDGNA